jgi:pyruvate dehydrogenase complex dehydrogenase (E1) component
MESLHDPDPAETAEWRDAFLALAQAHGPQRARQMLVELARVARQQRIGWQPELATPYVNTIAAEDQPPFPGDLAVEERLASLMRWNALAMVAKANQAYGELGGHIASYASAADLFETGFNHFFHARSEQHRGDLVFFQPHSAPGVYARAFLEGRLSEEDLAHYRQELTAPAFTQGRGARGLSSYPHPYLMPDFWQFPTGSMGIGPISSIYHARFMRYLTHRNLLNCEGRKVWGVFGDGEMDEPESMSALTLAAREKLDNLVWVVNCNLQRLDGPVRGNGRIIDELEKLFAGAGCDPGRQAGRDPVLQAGRQHAGDAVPARPPQGAGRLPAQAPRQGRRAAQGARPGRLQGGDRPDGRRPRDLDHAGLRALPHRAAARQGTRPARGAHPGRRGAHLRHGRPVPPDRHLQPRGQKYTPQDRDQVSYYKEDVNGQILQEGINEAGGMASWIAAATSYSTSNRIMIPFYIYYSMFGLQRVGDLCWAAGDMQARGFLLGGTSGRTTLNGEGLQHEDGHSHIMAQTIPNCVSYDPTFAHEVAVIMQDGLKRMVEKQENVFYYITLLNENYPMPGLQPGTEEQIVKGMYLCKPGAKARSACSCSAPAPSCASRSRRRNCWPRTGACRPTCGAARASTSWRRDGLDCERHNLLHPTSQRRACRS